MTRADLIEHFGGNREVRALLGKLKHTSDAQENLSLLMEYDDGEGCEWEAPLPDLDTAPAAMPLAAAPAKT